MRSRIRKAKADSVLCPSSGGNLRTIALGLLLLALLLTGGCSTFNHDWKKTSRQPPTDDLQGCWQGAWISEVNGHNDKLRCVVTKKEDGIYRARFHAKYQKVFSFGYTVTLTVERTGEATYKFNGEADLGWLLGVYHYEGHTDQTNFFSTYSCQYDHGTFQMTRPEHEIEKEDDAGKK